MREKRMIRTALMGLVLSAVLVSTAAASGTGKVNVSSVRLRKGPSTSTETIATLSRNSSVTVLEPESGGWYKVTCGKGEGYIFAEYLDVSGTISVSGTVSTGGSVLNVRSGAGTSHARVATLRNGASVEILGEENGWYKISYSGGKTGYVSADYVEKTGEENVGREVTPTQEPAAPASDPAPSKDPAPAEEPAKKDEPAQTEEELYGRVNTGGSVLNVRTGPGTSYERKATLSNGTKVQILGKDSGWYKISYGSSKTGYASCDYVKEISGDADDLAQQIIDYALSFLGVPYKYGAAGPKSFDCSGFTQYVYKHFGYNINRGASSQMSNGTVVSEIEDLEPGDLIFFNNGSKVYKATHVGIYIGDNQFVHASTGDGYDVQIDNLIGTNKEKTFVGGRRIIK